MRIFKLKSQLIASLGLVCCLIGFGSPPAQAQLAAAPSSLSFPIEGIGVPSPAQTVTVSNPTGSGVTSLSPNSFIISGAEDFSLGQNNCPDTTLTQGQSCTLTVIFTPIVAGIRNATLAIGAFGSDAAIVSLKGGVDQCAAALPLGNATGCGVLITVTAVDAAGNATSFAATVTGNGNPYDLADDTLVGIQNNTSNTLTSITLTTSAGSPLPAFGFDGDGMCTFSSNAPNDCLTHFPTGYVLTLYEGPNNTFTGVNGTFTSGTANFINFPTTGGIPASGSAYFSLEGTPQGLATATQTGQTLNPNSSANLMQQFVFNSSADMHVEFDFDFTTSFNQNTLTIEPNTVPKISDSSVTPSDYGTMVNGTALAETTCFTDPGQLDGNGAAACPRFTIECTNDNSSVLSGENCPQSTARNLFFKHVLSITLPTIPPGSAPTLAMGSDIWSPGNCTLLGPETGELCPKSAATQFTDCCKGGGTITHPNSSFILGCCEREWTTTPTIPLWSNNTMVPVSFTTVPPSIPNPNPNNWVAAPGQSVTFGFEAPGTAPDPTFPVPTDTTLPNPKPPSGNPSTPCTPLSWGAPASTFNTSGEVTVPGDGMYELHFYSTDCDDMEELIYNSANGANNWAMFKTAAFNVDSSAPTVTSVTLSGPSDVTNGVYGINQPATASVACSDTSGIVNSGIAQCGSNVALQTFGGPGTGPLSVTATNVPVPTSTAGLQTFHGLAKDVAGNSSQLFNVPYCVGYSSAPSSGNVVGFFQQPVDNPGPSNAVNSIKSGQAVPLKWGPVTNCSGAAVTNLAPGTSIGGTGTVNITLMNAPAGICATAAIDNTLTVTAAGASTLQNLGGGSYQFNLKPVGPHGACLLVSVNLGDGILHPAYLQIK